MTTKAQPTVSQEEYERIALADHPDVKWELHDGTLREKPGMTAAHIDNIRTLRDLLIRNLDPDEYVVCTDDARLHSPSGNNHIPDLCVVRRTAVRRARLERPRRLELYEEPALLVVESWSPSTGRYDIDTKFPDYRLRGDLEIWRMHSRERSVRRWARGDDGSYLESLHTDGVIHTNGLPGMAVDLARLFQG